MKLEIKHLYPYLPYGLKGIYNHENEENTIVDITGLCLFNSINHLQIRFKDNTIGLFDRDIKPILRPLSDLEDNEDNTPEELSKCYWSYTQKLISEHYDVFGLIPEGLAIDVNTLNKQPKPL